MLFKMFGTEGNQRRSTYLSYIMSIRASLLNSFTSASVESVTDKNSSSSAGGVLGGVTKASSVKRERNKKV